MSLEEMSLKEMRLSSGLKANKIAEVLGVSRVQLYKLEKNINKLDKLKIEKLSELYQVSKSEILKCVGETK